MKPATSATGESLSDSLAIDTKCVARASVDETSKVVNLMGLRVVIGIGGLTVS